MKQPCDCVLPEYTCADCPNRPPPQELYLVARESGVPGYVAMCGCGIDTDDAARVRDQWKAQGRTVVMVTVEAMKAGVDEYRRWRDRREASKEVGDGK